MSAQQLYIKIIDSFGGLRRKWTTQLLSKEDGWYPLAKDFNSIEERVIYNEEEDSMIIETKSPSQPEPQPSPLELLTKRVEVLENKLKEAPNAPRL